MSNIYWTSKQLFELSGGDSENGPVKENEINTNTEIDIEDNPTIIRGED